MNQKLPCNFPDSRISGETPGKKEQIFGYFLGPCLVYMVYNGLAGTYLTQFYTDVLGLAGNLLTFMPLISKILSSVTGLLIGRLIDRTRTPQGKARPWILISGILLTVSGFLLYAVPRASRTAQIIWVVVSYNLFFSLAFSVYSLSHSLMVPLSTRDIRQRDALAMLTSTGTSMLPGMLTTILMPLLVSKIGVGSGARGAWLTVMGLLSVVAIPATLLEYFFTLERVTAESDGNAQQQVPFLRQVSACFRDRYWVLVLVFTLLVQFAGSLSGSSMLYYCNWVLGNSVESGAKMQILVNMIGQAPLGFGVVALWPLVRKFGKRRVTILGFAIAALGSGLVLLHSDDLLTVLGCLFLKSIGTLPTYVVASLLAEALDHVEWQQGFRADGCSASVSSIVQTLVLGLAQTLLLAGIQRFGYVSPESTAQVLNQPESVQVFFRWCFAGIPMICYGICAVLMIFYRLESEMPRISQALAGNRK